MAIVGVGTRGSLLARTQTQWVVDQLQALSPAAQFSTEIYKTQGDKVLDVALSQIGGKGLFTKELEDALLAGQIDLAVHSLKDMPTELPQGLMLGCTPPRVDARDVVITADGKGLLDLPAGAQVGTSSLRRVAQLRAVRPDLEFVSVRGNVDTRLRKLAEGQVAALVMAAAGLHRAGFADRITQYLDPEVCLPAVGQGALVVEIRRGDSDTARLVALLHDEPTAQAVAAERAFLARLQGGCQIPCGAYARITGEQVHLAGLIASTDGKTVLRSEVQGRISEAGRLGEALADELLARGGDAILAALRPE